MAQRIPIYIPTYINSPEYTPARVLPRLLFYNGLVDCETYYVESGSLDFGGVIYEQNAFPYFDNYNVVSGSFPTSDSLSLLFNNEGNAYGEIPTENLYTQYWETYISLLYNPYTRLVNCSAIIPLADYFQMELNDIVNFRGNYFHLRAINDYSLKTGECNLQLLGPIIGTTFATDLVNTPTTTTTAGPTTTTTTISGTTTTTTFSNNPCICTEVVITSNGGEVSTFDCYGQNKNYVYFSAGTYYLCAASLGGLLQAFITAGTGTVSPVGNCKTGTCPPAPTTTTTTAGTTSTTTAGTTTTTLAPGCYNYQVINTSIGTFNDWLYVQCGENFSRSYDLPGNSTSSFCIQDAKYSLGLGLIITNTGACTTTTLAPGTCNTWVLSEGSSEVWYGNYVNCFGQPISGAFVDSQGAPFDSFICAIGTPERISGGFINPSGSCVITTTTTSTTTLAPGCFIYQVVNPLSGPIFNFEYVLCGENFSRSIELDAYSTSSLCVQDDKYERGTSAIVTRTATMCTTTTIAPDVCMTWVLDPGSSTLWYGNYTDCSGNAVSGAFVDSQSAPFDNYICALGTPQRISGGYLITSGSCTTTTTTTAAPTTTTTTTIAPGCYLATIINNNIGTMFVGNYVYCGNNFSSSFSVSSGTSASFCTQDQKIDLPSGPNYTSSFSAVGGCTTSTSTTTTLPPAFTNIYTADAWFDKNGLSFQVNYTGSNGLFTSSIIV